MDQVRSQDLCSREVLRWFGNIQSRGGKTGE